MQCFRAISTLLYFAAEQGEPEPGQTFDRSKCWKRLKMYGLLRSYDRILDTDREQQLEISTVEVAKRAGLFALLAYTSIDRMYGHVGCQALPISDDVASLKICNYSIYPLQINGALKLIRSPGKR